MRWRLKEPGHQQVWYWPNKPEYSVSSTKRVNIIGLIMTGICFPCFPCFSMFGLTLMAPSTCHKSDRFPWSVMDVGHVSLPVFSSYFSSSNISDIMIYNVSTTAKFGIYYDIRAVDTAEEFCWNIIILQLFRFDNLFSRFGWWASILLMRLAGIHEVPGKWLH